MSMITRQNVVDAARAWLGTPWKHQGRNRQGIDCIGLPVVVARTLGLSTYDSFAYSREPVAREFMSHFYKAGCVRIDPKKGRDGDLVLFHQAGYPCHAGILSTLHDRPAVIHAHLGHRKVVEEVLQPDASTMAVFTLPNVED